MMHQLENRKWKRLLKALSVRVNPLIGRHVLKGKRPYRALPPVDRQEAALFKAVLDGRFLLKGLTNRQLRYLLGSNRTSDPQGRCRESGRMTRRLRLLRAHGLIRKLRHTRYYRVTIKGHHTMSAALKLREADVMKLTA